MYGCLNVTYYLSINMITQKAFQKLLNCPERTIVYSPVYGRLVITRKFRNYLIVINPYGHCMILNRQDTIWPSKVIKDWNQVTRKKFKVFTDEEEQTLKGLLKNDQYDVTYASVMNIFKQHRWDLDLVSINALRIITPQGNSIVTSKTADDDLKLLKKAIKTALERASFTLFVYKKL